MEYPYILTAQTLTIYAEGRNRQIRTDHGHFSEVKEALKQKDFETIFALMDKVESIAEYWQGDVSIKDGVIFYKGQSVDNVLCDRILTMSDEGIDAAPMAAFLDNLMQNPSYNAVQELYLFLEHGNLPITPDGHFLAYKKVDDNFKDYNTGNFDNSPGKIVEMPRNQVDDNRNNTCSTGLHFCSLSYLPHYYGNQGKIIILKINPRDVVSIPSDYNNAKGRTCRYEVVGEYTGPETEHAFHTSVVDPYEQAGDPYDNYGDSWGSGGSWSEDDSYAEEGFNNTGDLTTEESVTGFAELDTESLEALKETDTASPHSFNTKKYLPLTTNVHLDGGEFNGAGEDGHEKFKFFGTSIGTNTDSSPTPDHPDLHNDGIPKSVKALVGQTRIRGNLAYEITAVAGPIRSSKGHYTGKWALYIKEIVTGIENVYNMEAILMDKIFGVGDNISNGLTADVLRLAHEYRKNMNLGTDIE
jgi:hypothetical protein